MANRKLDLADYFTSRRPRFIHQYRAPVFSDRRKNLTSLEAVSLVIPLHARDKSLFAEDVLRHLVRRLGNRRPIASAHPVLQASRDELLRHSPSGDTIGDPEEEQVERLAATRRLVPTVLRIQLAQDIEDRIELSAQPIYPIRQRRCRVLRQQHANQLPRASQPRHDCQTLGRRPGAEQPDERLEFSAGQAGCNGGWIVTTEHLPQKSHHCFSVGGDIDAILDLHVFRPICHNCLLLSAIPRLALCISGRHYIRKELCCSAVAAVLGWMSATRKHSTLTVCRHLGDVLRPGLILDHGQSLPYRLAKVCRQSMRYLSSHESRFALSQSAPILPRHSWLQSPSLHRFRQSASAS